MVRYSLILSAEGVVLPLSVAGMGGPGVGPTGMSLLFFLQLLPFRVFFRLVLIP
jgi:hypothetical protein